jgi:hypothetical protein
MPKAARISATGPASTISSDLPASTISSENSESSQFVAVALFSGIGLLVSLVAILMGVQAAWY